MTLPARGVDVVSSQYRRGDFIEPTLRIHFAVKMPRVLASRFIAVSSAPLAAVSALDARHQDSWLPRGRVVEPVTTAASGRAAWFLDSAWILTGATPLISTHASRISWLPARSCLWTVAPSVTDGFRSAPQSQ